MKGIEGNIHVITGGYGGIATATTAWLAERGGTVVLTGRQPIKGETKAEELRAATRADVRFFELDVTDSAAVDRIASQIETEVGPVHGLVVNAGTARLGSTFEYSDQDWHDTIAVNLHGAFYCCRSFGKRMRGRGGSIVLISSIASRVATRPARFVAYGVAKAGVRNLASVLGVEWAAEGIRVNAIEPGFTRSGPIEQLAIHAPEAVSILTDDTPMGRLMEPTEIANTIGFLLSDLSSGMTAASVVVDGGYSKK